MFKTSYINDTIISVGIFCFLILISINDLTTTDTSRLLAQSILTISIASTISTIFVTLYLNGIYRKQVYTVALYGFLTLYGILMSVFNDAITIGQNNVLINALVTISGLFLFAQKDNKLLPDGLAKYYVLYIFMGLCVTIATSGLVLSFPPHFIFEYASDLQAIDKVLYSQGVSRFFGLGAVAASYLIVRSKSKIGSLLLVIGCLVFLILSLLAGARGDSIAAVIVALGYLAYHFRLRFFTLLVWTGIIFYFFDWPNIYDSFSIFERITSIETGDYGSRDQLIIQVANLLFDEPRCLAIGCGFGYFQTHYGLEYGLYPHNFVIESLIVFGVPLSIFIAILVANGIRAYLRKIGSVDLFILFFFFSVLVDMKSGALFGGWLTTASCIYFATLHTNIKRIK